MPYSARKGCPLHPHSRWRLNQSRPSLSVRALGVPESLLVPCHWLHLNFFRDPDGKCLPRSLRSCSRPADGKVVPSWTRRPRVLSDRVKQVSDLPDPSFDVHVNRAPMCRPHHDVKYKPGAFLPAFETRPPRRTSRTGSIMKDGTFPGCAFHANRRPDRPPHRFFTKRVGDSVACGGARSD